MGKEAKLGVALIAVLLGAFGLVLYKRLKEAPPPAEAPAETQLVAGAAANEPEKPKLSSGPLKPTVVQSSTAEKAPPTLPNSDAASVRQSPSSRYGNHNSPAATTGTDGGPATNDLYSSRTSAAGSRYSDRYATTIQQSDGAVGSSGAEHVAGAIAQDATTATVSSPTSSQGDPFSRYGNRGSGGPLTPTGDASAALLPASATAEAPLDKNAAPDTVVEQNAADVKAANDTNPLRSSSSDSPSDASSSRYSRPRSYDLYGDASSSADSPPTETPSSSDTSNSRLRFSQAGGAGRYGGEPAAPVSVAEQTTAGSSTQPGMPSRYNASTSTEAPLASSTSGAVSRSGWSGAGTTVSTGSTSSGNPATLPRSASPPPTPVHTTRTVPVPVHRGETYVVEPNDSFSTISEKLYGTASYFKALQEHNKAKFPRPDRLRTGDVVSTPSAETLLQKYPNLCPRPNHLPLPGRSSTLTSQRGSGRVYVVEEGDTLFDIARLELGKATRWAEIYELNKDVIGEDFNHLRPGTQLVLPAEARDDSFTRRPGVSLPR
jgi:nucleoid-associated protein YgaU